MTEKKSVFDGLFPEREYTSSGWVEGTKAHVYGITVDTEKPITGVIANNDIVQFLGDGFCDAIDLGWEEAIEEFTAEHGREPDDDETDEMASGMDGCSGLSLIGDWKKVKGLWEADENGSIGYAAIARETVTQVIWSRTTVRADHCSPCYPGQADIGSGGPFLAYTLPAEEFDAFDE